MESWWRRRSVEKAKRCQVALTPPLSKTCPADQYPAWALKKPMEGIIANGSAPEAVFDSRENNRRLPGSAGLGADSGWEYCVSWHPGSVGLGLGQSHGGDHGERHGRGGCLGQARDETTPGRVAYRGVFTL